jgi:hypothetical protein
MISDTSKNKHIIFEALGDVYNITVITEFNEVNNNRIQQLWSMYQGARLKQNYTPQVLKRLIEGQRFDLGFFILEREGQVVASFGLSLYNEWAIGTRYIKHSEKVEPIAGAVIAPFLKQYLKGTVKGMAVAYNSDEKRTLGLFNQNVHRVHVYKNLSESDLQPLLDFQELEYDVLYRNTRQRVFYAPYEQGAVPNFTRYQESTNGIQSS